MYFEVWIDTSMKREVEKELRNACDEVYEVFYDYNYIVKVKDEKRFEYQGCEKVQKALQLLN